jgi:hypothetical protein
MKLASLEQMEFPFHAAYGRRSPWVEQLRLSNGMLMLRGTAKAVLRLVDKRFPEFHRGVVVDGDPVVYEDTSHAVMSDQEDWHQAVFGGTWKEKRQKERRWMVETQVWEKLGSRKRVVDDHELVTVFLLVQSPASRADLFMAVYQLDVDRCLYHNGLIEFIKLERKARTNEERERA